MPNSGSIDEVFRALADPSRRAIVERLVVGPAPVSELAQRLATSLSATVQHLAVLEASGLVRSEKVGRVRTCRLEAKTLKKAEAWFAKRHAQLERNFERLERYLAEGRDLSS